MSDNWLPAFEVPNRGLFSRFTATVVEVCRGPVSFYERLEPAEVRGITLFAWLCTFIGTALGAAINAALCPWLLQFPDLPVEVSTELKAAEILARCTLLLAPLIALFAVHLVAGLLHISTRPFAKEPAAYDETYRFVVYAFAPLAFMWVPVVGLVAIGFFFAVLTLAMRRLFGLGRFEAIFAVVLPVLALGLTWTGVIQPRLAPALVERAWPVALATDEEPRAGPNVVKEDPTPPLPDPNRSHEVELKKDGNALFSERSTTFSQGKLRVVHRAERKDAVVAVCVILESKSEKPFTGLAARADLIDGISVDDVVARAVRLDDEVYTLTEDAASPWGFRERLEPSEKFSVCFDLTTTKEPREILQLGPTVGRMP